MRKTVATDRAPRAIGPYSQAVVAGQLLFCSGQIPLDPATGQMIEGGIAAQTQRALQNIAEILTAAGATFDDIVKTTVYLTDMNEFAAMNEVYASFFSSPAPARSTVEARRLPRDARVEIEVVALLRPPA
jgi:2-iminobutanoate/2-iminopropanoate deaminase